MTTTSVLVGSAMTSRGRWLRGPGGWLLAPGRPGLDLRADHSLVERVEGRPASAHWREHPHIEWVCIPGLQQEVVLSDAFLFVLDGKALWGWAHGSPSSGMQARAGSRLRLSEQEGGAETPRRREWGK